jgi:hypothetical protein
MRRAKAIAGDGADAPGATDASFGRSLAAVRPVRERMPEWRMPRNAFLVKAVLFSLIAVALQIFGVRISSNPRIIYAQGRYLFPVMGFAAVLFVIGTKTAFDALGAVARAMRLATRGAGGPIRAGEFALKALAVVALFVLTIAIWQYIVPVFHLTISSPHSGI